MLLKLYDATMRLPLAALALFFLVREWQALLYAQGSLRVTGHVATMLPGRSLSVMPETRKRVTEGG